MFQKLYRHLEEVNSNLQRQQRAVLQGNELEEKINLHLDNINKTLIAQNQLIDGNRLNRSAAMLQKAAFVICAVGIAFVVTFSFYAFQFLRTTRPPSTGMTAADPDKAKKTATEDSLIMRTTELYGYQVRSDDHVAKLDSLIAEQVESIRELKLLNTAAIHNFIRIRKQLDQIHRVEPQPVHADSLGTAISDTK